MNEKDKFPAQWEAINMAFENGKQQERKRILDIIDKYLISSEIAGYPLHNKEILELKKEVEKK